MISCIESSLSNTSFPLFLNVISLFFVLFSLNIQFVIDSKVNTISSWVIGRYNVYHQRLRVKGLDEGDDDHSLGTIVKVIEDPF